jgi:MYXO-CTERM domain-containing protein
VFHTSGNGSIDLNPPDSGTKKNSVGYGYTFYKTGISDGTWQCFEVFIDVPNSTFRVWINGTMATEDKSVNFGGIPPFKDFLIPSNSRYLDTQVRYIDFDDIAITNSTPSKKDAHGNPYIGPLGGGTAGGAGAGGSAGSAGSGASAGVGGSAGGSAGSAGSGASAGVSGSAGGSAGSAGSGASAGVGGSAGAGAGGSTGGTGGSSVDGGKSPGGSKSSSDDGGCGCRTRAKPPVGGALGFFAFFGLLLARRRRHRRETR